MWISKIIINSDDKMHKKTTNHQTTMSNRTKRNTQVWSGAMLLVMPKMKTHKVKSQILPAKMLLQVEVISTSPCLNCLRRFAVLSSGHCRKSCPLMRHRNWHLHSCLYSSTCCRSLCSPSSTSSRFTRGWVTSWSGWLWWSGALTSWSSSIWRSPWRTSAAS